MKMWSMKITILLLFCYGCLSTSHRKVYFDSRNFFNELKWDPVKTGQNVTYSVQYWSDADEEGWLKKEECQDITALSCNLTAETPSINDVHYKAKVIVNGSLHGITTRFKPIEKTTFGPPILDTTTTVSSLHAVVNLPLGPNGVSVGDIINSTIKGPSNSIFYTLKITHPKWAEKVHQTTNGQFIINLKKNQTQYCGSVVYTPSSPHGRSDSEEARFCVKLLGDSMLLPWLLTSAALLAAIVIISAVCMWNYVKGGKEKSIPQQLTTSSSILPRVLEFPDETLIISKPEICSQTIYAKIQVNHPKMPSVVRHTDGYSPQDIASQAWQGSSGSSMGTGARSPTPDPEGTSAQSSETYCAVAVRPSAEEKYSNRDAIKDIGASNLPFHSTGESWDIGGIRPNLTSHGIPLLHDPDSCDNNPARPLLLDTVRDANGQLMLPSLTFQLESNTGNSQIKPLLSDLIESEKDGPSLVSLQSLDGSEFSDSGCDSTQNTPTQPYCNTHYFPSQQVIPDFNQRCQNSPPSESGYKKNWMPVSVPAGNASIDSCEYRRTDYPWAWTGNKKEDEVEEDKEGQTIPINLGSWLVQIQE